MPNALSQSSKTSPENNKKAIIIQEKKLSDLSRVSYKSQKQKSIIQEYITEKEIEIKMMK